MGRGLGSSLPLLAPEGPWLPGSLVPSIQKVSGFRGCGQALQDTPSPESFLAPLPNPPAGALPARQMPGKSVPGKEGLAPEGLLDQPFQQQELREKLPCARDSPSSAICLPGLRGPQDALPR